VKSVFIVPFLFLIVGASVQAAPKKRTSSQRLCDWFQSKVDLECSHIMCDDDIANGTNKDLDDCTSADDYVEAAQGGCDGQPTTVEDLEKAYNKKHHTHIKCDE